MSHPVSDSPFDSLSPAVTAAISRAVEEGVAKALRRLGAPKSYAAPTTARDMVGVNDVVILTGLSRATVARRVHGDPCRKIDPDPDFPKPVKTGGRSLFVRAEVEAWRDRQLAAR